MIAKSLLLVGFVALIAGCSKEAEDTGPATSSAEAQALTAAANAAATNNPEEALLISQSAMSRDDISVEDLKAAAAAQDKALKKLTEAAAAGDQEAQKAMERYRSRK